MTHFTRKACYGKLPKQAIGIKHLISLAEYYLKYQSVFVSAHLFTLWGVLRDNENWNATTIQFLYNIYSAIFHPIKFGYC